MRVWIAGVLEVYTSDLATVSRYLGRDLSDPDARALLRTGTLTVLDVIARARSGDARAMDALRETGHYLGLGMAIVVHTRNPALIFVGGEITAGWDLIEQEVRATLEKYTLTTMSAGTPIIPDQMDRFPCLRGATALVAAPVFAAPQIA